MRGVYNGGQINLTATSNGTAGNGLPIQPYTCGPGAGFYAYTPFLTGGANIGSTGASVVPVGPYTGLFSAVLMASGSYSVPVSGNQAGVFSYTRTFTGAWDVLTGIDATSLVSLKRPGNYDDNTISGQGVFPANSSMIFQLVHSGDRVNTDGVALLISGLGILNPVVQSLYN